MALQSNGGASASLKQRKMAAFSEGAGISISESRSQSTKFPQLIRKYSRFPLALRQQPIFRNSFAEENRIGGAGFFRISAARATRNNAKIFNLFGSFANKPIVYVPPPPTNKRLIFCQSTTANL